MAEFFGGDYAGDDEVEQFGGGAVGRPGAAGSTKGPADGDTDGDGDDDSIGTGPFLIADDASGDQFRGGPAAAVSATIESEAVDG